MSGESHASPENFEISKPYNAIFSFLGAKLRTEDRVFHSRKCSFHNLTFDYQLQSIPTSNKQMMKTKLRTFARKQILRKPTCIKKLESEKLTEI